MEINLINILLFIVGFIVGNRITTKFIIPKIKKWRENRSKAC